MRILHRITSATLPGLLALALTPLTLADGVPAGAATPPTLAIGAVDLVEGNVGTTPARVSLRLSDPLLTDTIVRYAVAGGTATATDLKVRTGSVKIRAGRASAVVTAAIFADTEVEGDETATVTITDAGSVAVADAVGEILIRDDDTAGAGLSIGDAIANEGDTGKGVAKLTITQSEIRPVDTVIAITTTAASATTPTEFKHTRARAVIRAGRTHATLSPVTFGDITAEADETFIVTITVPAPDPFPVTDGIGTVTIRDDDTPLTPGAPGDLAAVAGPQNRTLTATWTPAASPAPILGYDLEVTLGANTNIVDDVTSPFSFGCGLFQITATCTLRVRARTDAGAGPWSAPIQASTWAPPAAPPDLTAIGGSAVSWSAPASDQPITHYLVQYSTNQGQYWVQDGTTTNLYSSVGCSNCMVRVAGSSSVGIGPWAVTTIALPGTPTDLAAVRDGEIHELVRLTWTAPDPGSRPIDRYDVTATAFVPGLGVFSDYFTATGTAVDRGLRSTYEWTISVRAVSALGSSPVPATVVLPAG